MAKRTKRGTSSGGNNVRARAIAALENEHGRVTAEALVQAASNPRHPLHHEFLWDDSKAAHKYRLEQARVIIASVRIVITHHHQRTSAVGYVRDPEAMPRQQGYVSIKRLQNEEENAMDALDYEIRRLQAILERCREIAEALKLIPEYDDAVASVLRLSSRLRRGRPPRTDKDNDIRPA
jgi:hypothetical protein